jgi:hypothetical protein
MDLEGTIKSGLLGLLARRGFFRWSDDGTLPFRGTGTADDPLVVDLPSEGAGPFDLDTLINLLGRPELRGAVPEGLLLASGVYLTRFEVALGATAASSVFLGLSWPGAGWALLPSIELSSPTVVIGALDGSFFGSLSAAVAIGGVDLAFRVTVPGLAATARLGASRSVALEPFLARYRLPSLGFEHLTIEDLEIAIDRPNGSQSFSLSAGGVWSAGIFDLGQITLSFEHTSGGWSAELGGVATLGKAEIRLDASHGPGDAGFQLEGSLSSGDPSAALKALLEKLDLADRLPAPLSGATVKSLAISFNTDSKALTASLASTIAGLGIHADLDVQKDAGGGHDVHVHGELTLADRTFDVTFGHDQGTNAFAAVYSNPGGEKLDLGALLKEATGDSTLGSVELTVKDVALVHGKSAHVFAADLDAGIDLSGLGHLPLIGKLLPRDQALKLSFTPMFVSDPAPAPSALALWPKGGPTLKAPLKTGFQFVTDVCLGDLRESFPFSSDLTPSKADQVGKYANLGSPVSSPPDAKARETAAKITNSVAKSVQWIDLQRHFGPLHLDRLGLAHDKGVIFALLDAALAIGPLELGLEGLGASYDLGTRRLHFFLDGLAVAFETAALSVSAAFLRLGDQFAGKAMLRMENLALGALGAYQKFNGHPSLFLYAFVDYPLGGPTFFFVEGLAVGFGFNRRLIVPPIGEIHTFPLVAEVIGAAPKRPGKTGAGADPIDGIRAEMESLARYVPAEMGQYFICAGIKFNSFRILDGFALLVGSFGERFEIDLLGVLALKLPADAPEVLAEVEMEFAARVVPLEGFVGVQAQLTPRSFILSRQCHLQGGFAFSSWLLGEHAGDFVYSMGGYHPRLAVPAHYPVVPRLAFAWSVDDSTSLKGSMYYALTSGAAMAGGSLEATWSKGPVDAWFHLGLDMLMQWTPYHYEATGYAEIGAHVNIKVPLIGRVRVSIDAGAEVALWGPELAGRADVHVRVMGVKVSFSVAFDSGGKKDAPAITWPALAKAFLPEQRVGLSVRGGLIRTLKDDAGKEERWIINPKELVLVTDTAIPVKVAGSAGFGVAPMGLDHVTKSEHSIAVKRDEKDVPTPFEATPVMKRFPSALWGKTGDRAAALDPEADALVLVGGFELRPVEPPKAETKAKAVERGHLAYAVSVLSLPAAGADAPAYASRESKGLQGALAESASRRRAVLQALKSSPAQAVSLNDGFADAFTLPPRCVGAI